MVNAATLKQHPHCGLNIPSAQLLCLGGLLDLSRSAGGVYPDFSVRGDDVVFVDDRLFDFAVTAYFYMVHDNGFVNLCPAADRNVAGKDRTPYGPAAYYAAR